MRLITATVAVLFAASAQAALPDIFGGKTAPPLAQGVFGQAQDTLDQAVLAGNALKDQAETAKYDKVGQVTGRYYCGPGYCTVPLERRRALLQQSSLCVECGINAYCPGGFQTRQNPNKVDCPLPSGTGVTEFTTGGATTSTSREDCIVSCVPGSYAPDPVFGPCDPCGYGYYCPGGYQGTSASSSGRFPCPAGTNTTIVNANNPGECVR